MFSAQLENARRQADHANLRSAYALVQTANILGKDEVDGIADKAAYCTDGTFGSTTAAAVKLQSKTHDPSDTSKAGCEECVVKCDAFNTATGIYVVGSDETGWSLEATITP